MRSDNGRAVPPTSWDYVSLQQIRDMLHPDESEEDVYRLFDQCGEWVAAAEWRLDEHDRHWADVADSDAGDAHTAAAAYAAQTRAELAAVLEEVRQVQTSLETVIAKFSDVRNKIVDQYADYQSAREPVLGWMLARDDERGERKQREATLRARELMAQYERTTNDELAKWPSTGDAPLASSESPVESNGPTNTVIAMSNTDFLLMNGPTMPLADSPTKPIRPHDGQSQSSASSASGVPGGAFSAGSLYPENEAEHHNTFSFGDKLFDSDDKSYPPVIGDNAEYRKDEDESW